MVQTPRYQEPRQPKKLRKQQTRERPHQPQPHQPQPRQQNPRQQLTTDLPKKKKVEFKAQAVTLADLESDMEWHSDSDGSYESAYSYRSFDLIGEEDRRLVTSSKPLASQIETKRRIPVKERLEQPNTYASKLKGPAPEKSAKPLEPLKFVRRNSNKEEEDDPRVGGQWRIATLSRRGKRSPAAGTKYPCAPANGLTNDLHRTRVFLCPMRD